MQLLAVCLLFSILLLAQVRVVWLGLLAFICFMPAMGLRWNPRDRRKLLAGACLCLGLFLAVPKSRHLLWARAQSFHLTEMSIQQRLAVLHTTSVLKTHWLSGVGFGQFPTACEPYYHSNLSWVGTPDNQYLRWLIENEILGFCLLMAFFVGLVHAGWKKIQLMEDVQEADFYKSLLAGWLCTAFTFLFFDGFYWGACNMTFWSLLGMFAVCLKAPGATLAD